MPTGMAAPSQGDLFATTPPAAPPPAPEPVVPEGPKTITLFDASGFIFRAYHALPPLTTSKGVPTNAVLGFTRMVLKVLRERAPTHVALCFDRDSRKGRLEIDPQYKANREAPPDDLMSQFALIRKVVEVLELPIIEYAGWEADDVIATLCGQAQREGWHVEVLTSDKDFLQLLDPHVRLFDPMKDQVIDEAVGVAKYGVKPAQMRDYLALVGDAIDNVPKVPGIGPKTAQELLGTFGSVPQLIARVDEVAKPKVREALKTHREQLERALKLVTFRDDLPLEVSLDGLARKEIRRGEAAALFTELEFFRLIQEMPSAPATPLAQAVKLVQTLPELDALLEVVAAAPMVALAPDTDGPAHTPAVRGLGLQVPQGDCAYLDLAALGGEALPKLQAALARTQVTAHDAKALLHALRAVGVAPPKLHADVELVSYLLNPSRKEHALLDLARERLRVELPEAPEPELPVAERAQAIGARADAVARLTPELWTEADGVGLGELARGLELPLVEVLAKMEARGVRLDLPALAATAHEVDQQCESLLQEVYKHAGRELNVGSPIQLAQVLFDELKLPVLKRNKTGPSTDHEVLEKLAEQHPLPLAIIEYRNVAKLKSTYLDTLPTLVGADGRIRTTFHQATAATGRLSSTDPNLQNIPIRTELGKQIRRAFVAEPGQVLVSADYSQIELRILAHISGDEALVAAFHGDADVHARTAAEVFGVELGQVTGDQRRAAKMVNYGIAYGLSPHGLSTRLRIPVEEAKSIIDRYFERFPGIHRYVEETVEVARKKGYVESLFGRRRYMPDLVSRNRNVAMGAERAAINMPIQATAADLIKRAMLELEQRLEGAGLGRLLLQVHDELLFEAPEAQAGALKALAIEVMTHVASWKVPLVVQVGIGRSWADAH